MKKRKILLTLSAASLMGALLVGCAGGTNTAGNAPAPGTNTANAPAGTNMTGGMGNATNATGTNAASSTNMTNMAGNSTNQ